MFLYLQMFKKQNISYSSPLHSNHRKLARERTENEANIIC